MPKDVLYGKTLRKSFARSEEIQDMPNLLEIQKASYKWFLETGLREVFRDVDTVTDFSGNLELSFIDYKMDERPKYSIEECKARDSTYAAPLKVRVRLRNSLMVRNASSFLRSFVLLAFIMIRLRIKRCSPFIQLLSFLIMAHGWSTKRIPTMFSG